MHERITNLTQVLKKKPYSFIVWPLSLLYFAIIMGTYLYIYDGDLTHFFRSFPLWYTLLSTLFTAVNSVLGGIAITLFIAKIHELHLKSAGLGITGLFVGSLAAGCPGCFFGLFPIILSFFGITGTLAVLPLNGIELQIATFLLLGLSIFFLAKETDVSCELPQK